jgi:predicted metal-dependent HD superfamily phosphohydrolase
VNLATRERWLQLWRDLEGGRPERAAWFERLQAAWSEPHRHYHNLAHLGECLRELDAESSSDERPPTVELALWFHDAIYNPRADDNEEQSAALARECLCETELHPSFARRVAALILATKRHDVSGDLLAPLMVDVDLSILGQPEARFWEYEAQIREEYIWVPDTVFAPKRAEILEQFLSRKRIYSTKYFFEKCEVRARANLQASIQRLRQIISPET